MTGVFSLTGYELAICYDSARYFPEDALNAKLASVLTTKGLGVFDELQHIQLSPSERDVLQRGLHDLATDAGSALEYEHRMIASNLVARLSKEKARGSQAPGELIHTSSARSSTHA